jgi:hypothetical protein
MVRFSMSLHALLRGERADIAAGGLKLRVAVGNLSFPAVSTTVVPINTKSVTMPGRAPLTAEDTYVLGQ